MDLFIILCYIWLLFMNCDCYQWIKKWRGNVLFNFFIQGCHLKYTNHYYSDPLISLTVVLPSGTDSPLPNSTQLIHHNKLIHSIQNANQSELTKLRILTRGDNVHAYITDADNSQEGRMPHAWSSPFGLNLPWSDTSGQGDGRGKEGEA